MIWTETWSETKSDDKITTSHDQRTTGWVNTQSSRLKCLAFLFYRTGHYIVVPDRSAIVNLWLDIHNVIAQKHKSAGNFKKNQRQSKYPMITNSAYRM